VNRRGVVLVAILGASLLTACGGVSRSTEDNSTGSTNNGSPVANTNTESNAASNSDSDSGNDSEATTDTANTTGDNNSDIGSETIETTVEPSTETVDQVQIAFNKATAIAFAAGEIVKQGLVSDAITAPGTLLQLNASLNPSQSNAKTSPIAFSLTQNPTMNKTVVEDIDPTTLQGECGGTMTSAGSNGYDDELLYPYFVEGTVEFSDYCLHLSSVFNGDDAEALDAYSIIFNGTGIISGDLPNAQEGHYEFLLDFGLTTDAPMLPPSVTLNQAVSCSYYNGASDFDASLDCSFTVIYDTEGQNFSANEFRIEGDNIGGYDVNVTFSDIDDNLYGASFFGLSLCANGNFGTGSGSISYNEELIDIEYTNCDEVVITYLGNSETVGQ